MLSQNVWTGTKKKKKKETLKVLFFTMKDLLKVGT